MFGKKAKEIKFLKKENKKLEDKIEGMEENAIDRSKEITRLNEQLDEQQMSYEKELKEKGHEIEKLESELDILYRYYHLDQEPTQYEKTSVRIDKRVHELELENMELRMRVDNYISQLRLQLERDIAQTRLQACGYGPYYGLVNSVNTPGYWR